VVTVGTVAVISRSALLSGSGAATHPTGGSVAPADHHSSRFRSLTWMLRQAVLVLLGVLAYFGIRGLTEGSAGVAALHAENILELERSLGIDVEAEIQALVTASDTVITLANWVYIWGHWPVIVVTMVWLAWRHRPVFLRLRNTMLASGALGMIVYVSYPVAPPRLVPIGVVDTITERSVSYRVLQPPTFVNQYAAMPSLHVGWNLLVGMSILAAASTVVLRVVAFLLPVLMSLSVVVTGNHYLLDVVMGLSLVLAGHYVAVRLERRRRVTAGARDEPV
jgi:membrane-associated phospholipid phosphatase